MRSFGSLLRTVGLLSAALSFASAFHAQQPVLYGAPIPLEKAKTVAAAALAEAEKNGWRMAVTIVDSSGQLVFFEKMDGTQLGSIDVSMAKARSAILFMRPTKTFDEGVSGGGGGLRILKLPGAMPIEGGIPLIENGKIIGAIGVSGAQPKEDGQCATAAAATIH
jgi:uncharacterized protein GlcG (DUF336 family)